MERTIAHCPKCRGLGWVKPDIVAPADPRLGHLVPCPACGDAVREPRELTVMELLQEHVVRYAAFRGSLWECTFESFNTASDEQVVVAYNAAIRFIQGEVCASACPLAQLRTGSSWWWMTWGRNG